MYITKIEKQKNNPSRKSIYIDGEFAFGVSPDVLLKFSLHEGMALTASESEMIALSESEETAKQKAMRYISIRPRTEKEIELYLGKKGYSEQTATAVISKFRDLNLLNDVEFVRMFCRDKLKYKPIGEPMIRVLLGRKGVPRAVTDAVLPEFFTNDSEREFALAAGRSQHARLLKASRTLDPLRMKKRIYDYLLRRGFSPESVQNAAKQIFMK